jgi:hypothetical protein
MVMGMVSWTAVAGLQGIGICAAPGSVAGIAPSAPGRRPARVLGGGIGRVVAGYFALASGEVLSPGTMEWALGGAAYAALFSLLVATIVGGMIGRIDPASGR